MISVNVSIFFLWIAIVTLTLESLNVITDVGMFVSVHLSFVYSSVTPLKILDTKKQIASALTFIACMLSIRREVNVLTFNFRLDCVGNIVGPQFVIQTQTPTFPTATKVRSVLRPRLKVLNVSANRSRQ